MAFTALVGTSFVTGPDPLRNEKDGWEYWKGKKFAYVQHAS